MKPQSGRFSPQPAGPEPDADDSHGSPFGGGAPGPGNMGGSAHPWSQPGAAPAMPGPQQQNPQPQGASASPPPPPPGHGKASPGNTSQGPTRRVLKGLNG
jgi:hypothetical protein